MKQIIACSLLILMAPIVLIGALFYASGRVLAALIK